MMVRTSRIRKANKATADQLAVSIPAEKSGYRFQVVLAKDLSDALREEIWSMLVKNMLTLYQESSLGWDPTSKRDEMFDSYSRYILVRRPESDELLAYTMFRFDVEDDQNVAYCYELQVSPNARRSGLGKTLMQGLHDIGRKWGMQKIMLTVFKANEGAVKFYKATGFQVDPSSPGYVGDGEEAAENEAEECDYWIMSRTISS